MKMLREEDKNMVYPLSIPLAMVLLSSLKDSRGESLSFAPFPLSLASLTLAVTYSESPFFCGKEGVTNSVCLIGFMVYSYL